MSMTVGDTEGCLTYSISLKLLQMEEELPWTVMCSRGQYAFPLFSSIYAF